MAPTSLLLIDLRRYKAEPDIANVLASRYRLKHVSCCKEIGTSLAEHCPDILCFDYDTPTTDGLAALRLIKCSYPSLPIIMLTEHHSESLALWALRTRVWDYFIKPVAMEELIATLEFLTTLVRSPEMQRQPHFPREHSVPSLINIVDAHNQRNRTQPSIQFMEDHYTHKITLDDVANCCYLSPGAFSHIFRKEQGITFSEYLLRYRVARATEHLALSNKSISEIAYAVGFNNLSYFSRVFRRYKKVSPSQFREDLR